MNILMEELQRIEINGLMLEGLPAMPPGARGLVLFAHGSGSSHVSGRQLCGDIKLGGDGTYGQAHGRFILSARV